MRIKIRVSSLNPSQLVSDISDVLIELAELGVDELDRVNLYLQLRSDGEEAELRTLTGGRVDILTVEGGTVRDYAENDPDAPRWSEQRNTASAR